MSKENSSFIDALNPMSIRIDKHKKEERLAICEQCEFFTRLKTCKVCGCIMTMKASLAGSSCPVGKWQSFG